MTRRLEAKQGSEFRFTFRHNVRRTFGDELYGAAFPVDGFDLIYQYDARLRQSLRYWYHERIGFRVAGDRANHAHFAFVIVIRFRQNQRRANTGLLVPERRVKIDFNAVSAGWNVSRRRLTKL